MADESVSIHDFLMAPGVILDVRSPAEYIQGHIPGAISLPLFSDAERAQVGTVYKKIGRTEAIELGMKIVGPKLADFAAEARGHVSGSCAKVYCWRGGMRSSSMAWLLRTAGLSAITLRGGYKAFRKQALDAFNQPRCLHVIGGLTGSGKTEMLLALRNRGEQVLDLEAIANHRGSSYGMFSQLPQPSNEHFVNELAMRWAAFDPKRPVWIENESRMIGQCCIPNALYDLMRESPLFLIQRPFSERVEFLLKEYGKADPNELVTATQRLQKRLGSQRTKMIVEYIREGNLVDAIVSVLHYYDTAYHHEVERRRQAMHHFSYTGQSNNFWAEQLLLAAHDK